MSRCFLARFPSVLALTGALVAGGFAQAPEAPAMNAPEDLAAVSTLRDGFSQAFNAGDAAAIGNLYTADAISEPNHEATVTGRDAIVAHNQEFFSQFDVSAQIMPDETMTVGDHGFDRGRFTMTLTPKAGGEAMTNEGRYLVLLEKQADGSWLVTRDIDNSTMPMPGMESMPGMDEMSGMEGTSGGM